MSGIGDDEQLLVFWIGIWFANKLVALSLAIHHIVIGSLTKVTRVGICTMHHENSRANLVDVV